MRLKNIEINHKLHDSVIEKACPSFSGQISSFKRRFEFLKSKIGENSESANEETVETLNARKDILEKLNDNRC